MAEQEDQITRGPLKIGNYSLEHPVMVGAGPIKTVEDVRAVAKSQSAAVVVGSITVEERLGNSGDTYFYDPEIGSVNAKGLPNGGLSYYRSNLAEMVKIAHDNNKPLILSAAGFTPREFVVISEMVAEQGVDGLELNIGCPNVWSDGKQKGIASFNPDSVDEILRLQEQALAGAIWTSLKLSPYSDPDLLKKIAEIIRGSKIINAVVASNTFPNALAFNREGNPALNFGKEGEVLGGLAGAALRWINQGQVRQLRRELPSHIDVIGVGGISQLEHVREYLHPDVSAIATQVTTAYVNEGPAIFNRLCL